MNRAAAAMFLALVCSGCPKRIEFGPEGPIQDAERLYQLVKESQDDVASLQGDGKVRVESPQGSGTLSLFLALSRPGLLHLETFDFFNRPVASLTANQARFGLYQPRDNTWFEGPASPANVSRFLPVAMPAEELVAVMLGQVPLLPPERMTLSLDEKEGVYVLTLYKGAVTQVLQVHPKFHRVVRSELRGVSAYDLAYEDFDDKQTLVFPRKVKLMVPRAKTELEVRYTEVTLNGPVDLSAFELAAPEGARVVPVDEAGREVLAAPPPPGPPAGT
ncbi:DUF4292 domain-containing protein [Myxococcaceae bacterium GXIMD 01537]